MTENQAPVTVHQAWASVMAEVRELGKDQRHDSPGAKFMFRGVDDVMNAVGPALRRHGVSVIPTKVELRHRDVTTSSGKPSREATVVVLYTIHGPAGDCMPGGSAGEAMDSGDKGTAKAMSVAYWTFLLQALCLPTHDMDPDAEAHHRGTGPTPLEQAQQVAYGLSTCGDLAKLEQVRAWSAERNLLDLPVTYDSAEGQATAPLGTLFAMHAERIQGGAAA